MSQTFPKWVRFALVYTLFIIIWGAWVRHTGSGAGCGDHWPLCDGQVIPDAEKSTTLIEFIHRLTSGLYGILILGLTIIAFKIYPQKQIRTLAVWSLILTIVEALIGAVLVKRGLVVDNTSIERAVVIGFHLANTFFLLAALTLFDSAVHAVKKGRVLSTSIKGLRSKKTWLVCTLWLLTGSLGAIASLANTLFPTQNLLEGIAQDFNPDSHFLLRLRIYHPIIAITASAITIFFLNISDQLSNPFKKDWNSRLLVLFIATNLCLGFIALGLKAPTSLALMHLLFADLIWIMVVRVYVFDGLSRSQ